MGRWKIKMEIVKDAASRLVTLSKRQNGLFKKANDLTILCGAELAIVVFSPGGKPFSFSHPSVDVVTQRFLRHLQDEDDGDEDSEAKSPAGGTSSSSGSKKARRKAEIEGLKPLLEKVREEVKLRKREMEAASSLLVLAKKLQLKEDDNNNVAESDDVVASASDGGEIKNGHKSRD